MDHIISNCRVAIASAAILVLVAACTSPNKSNAVIPDSTFVDLLVDLYLVDARHQEGLPPDSTLRPAILDAHNVTESQLSETVRFYSTNRDDFGMIYDKVIDRLTEEQTRYPSR